MKIFQIIVKVDRTQQKKTLNWFSSTQLGSFVMSHYMFMQTWVVDTAAIYYTNIYVNFYHKDDRIFSGIWKAPSGIFAYMAFVYGFFFVPLVLFAFIRQSFEYISRMFYWDISVLLLFTLFVSGCFHFFFVRFLRITYTHGFPHPWIKNLPYNSRQNEIHYDEYVSSVITFNIIFY